MPRAAGVGVLMTPSNDQDSTLDSGRHAHAMRLFFLVAFGFSWIFDLLPLVIPGVSSRIVRVSIRGKEGRAFAVAFLAPPLMILTGVALTLALGAGHLKPPANRPGWGMFILMILAVAALGPLINLPFALGEEIGWRGFLEPEWSRRRSMQGTWLTGVVWGLWHAPTIAMGHNYPGHPLVGIPMMIGITSFWNVFLVWCRRRSGSIWAPSLAHAGINALGGTGFLLLTPVDPRIGAPLGLIGWIPAGALALLLVGSSRDSVDKACNLAG
jgi:membrane protease YdiL (CAAX protease family)